MVNNYLTALEKILKLALLGIIKLTLNFRFAWLFNLSETVHKVMFLKYFEYLMNVDQW